MSTRSRPRLWPALAVLVLAVAGLAAVWLGGATSRQVQVERTLGVVVLAGLLLLVWLLALSRLPWRRRLAGLGAAVVALAAAAALFRIEGVSGDLVPILRPRWDLRGTLAGGPGAAELRRPPGAVDWPQFRGPGRDGRVPGVRLDPGWTAQPPRLLWRREVGAGWASFAVVGDAAVTLEQRGEREAVVRYDLLSGEPVWVREGPAPAAYRSTVAGDGPRSTPAVAGGRVYALGATGLLDCLDLESGERLWWRDVVAENGGTLPPWGLAVSPLVDGDLVVVAGGGPGRALVGYERVSGEPRWAQGNDPIQYASPLVARLAGVDQIVVFATASVAGHARDDGRLLWSWPWSSAQPNVAQPLAVAADRLLVSSGYGVGARLLEIAAGEDGLAARELWSSPRLKAKFAPFVQRDDTVYGLDDGVLVALDPLDGERRWKAGRYGHGQLLLAGAHLVVQAEDGHVALVAADPGSFRELARLDGLDDKTWNLPTLAGRYLVIRNHREAMAYELPVL